MSKAVKQKQVEDLNLQNADEDVGTVISLPDEGAKIAELLITKP